MQERAEEDEVEDREPFETLDKITHLLDAPEKLNNYWGCKVMDFIIPIICEKSGLRLKVDLVTAGSQAAVLYDVTVQCAASSRHTRSSRRLATEHVLFSGYPDFTVINKLRRRPYPNIIHTVGEMQSTDSLEDCVSQVGIYSLGNLVLTGQAKMVTVVLTKGMNAHILILRKNSDQWACQYVNSTDPMCFKCEADIQLFAQVLVSAIKWQQE